MYIVGIGGWWDIGEEKTHGYINVNGVVHTNMAVRRKQVKMRTIDWKFVGFIMVLFVMVSLCLWGKENRYAEATVAALSTLLAIMGRDLYRSTTPSNESKCITKKEPDVKTDN